MVFGFVKFNLATAFLCLKQKPIADSDGLFSYIGQAFTFALFHFRPLCNLETLFPNQRTRLLLKLLNQLLHHLVNGLVGQRLRRVLQDKAHRV